jgi:hypothetical protein
MEKGCHNFQKHKGHPFWDSQKPKKKNPALKEPETENKTEGATTENVSE